MTKSLVISLIGRPNVGKSSIFNRLMKKQHKAITFDQPGVTRDRHYGVTIFDELANEEKVMAVLVDTGGFYPEETHDQDVLNKSQMKKNSGSSFFNIMRSHAELAIEESDLVLFVVDVREGLNPIDQMIMNTIRKSKKSCWVIVNKYDSDKQEGEEYEFYSLGLGENELFKVSAAHGLGFINLKEKLHKHIVEKNKNVQALEDLQKGITPKERVVSKVAIVGAPNNGKSTLLNQLLGSERALVSPIAGTTVDPIEGYFDLFFGKRVSQLKEFETTRNDETLAMEYEQFLKEFSPELVKAEAKVESINDAEEIFSESSNEVDTEEVEVVATVEDKQNTNYWRSLKIVDTAGIRKNKTISGVIEQQSVYRSLRAITEAQIVILMIDATKGITHQDRRLADIALEKGCSIIVCLNKIDLIKDTYNDAKKRKEWLLDLEATVPWLQFCQLVSVSAKYNKNIKKLKDALVETTLVRHREIPTSKLNRVVANLTQKHSITLKGLYGKPLRVKYASHIKSDPPTFLMFSNRSKNIPDNYKQYLKNGLRKEFRLLNSPIHLIFRTQTELENRVKKTTKQRRSSESK